MGFSLTFFRLLSYLAAGGFVALALVPRGEVSRGFFRFSAALYAGLMAAAALGLGATGGEVRPWLFLFAPAATLGAIYATLFPGRALIVAAAAAGAAATAVDGLLPLQKHYPTGFLQIAGAETSALLLGSAITAMVLGHWYLVMPALPPDPLVRLTRLYAGSVLLRCATVAAAFGILYAAEGRALDRFLDGAGLMIWPRLLFGLVAPGVLALMALPTVRVRDTQPATGMLYVACVLVLVGEGIAIHLGLRTGVPI